MTTFAPLTTFPNHTTQVEWDIPYMGDAIVGDPIARKITWGYGTPREYAIDDIDMGSILSILIGGQYPPHRNDMFDAVADEHFASLADLHRQRS